MSSESSDDEHLELLREATDAQFINDGMFNADKKPSPKELFIRPVSLRKPKDEDEQFNLFRVTPEFQRHVAKHLMAALDKKLKYVSNEALCTDVQKKKKHKTGIKLLSNSESYLKIEKVRDNCESVLSQRRMVPVDKSNVTCNENELRLLAVNSNDLLSGKDISFWSKRCKRKPYEYKQTNGKLFLISEGS